MKQVKVNVRIPNPVNLETAIRIYYENIEIGNQEINELFGVKGQTILKLKKVAKEKMDADNVPNWNALKVNTEAAYRAWGLDINDLEKRHEKLKKLAV